MTQTFNVRDYGAGVGGDDLAAFQRAIDACNAAGGGTVLFPPGEYDLRVHWFRDAWWTVRHPWRRLDSLFRRVIR